MPIAMKRFAVKFLVVWCILFGINYAHADTVGVTALGWSAGQGTKATAQLACDGYKTAFALPASWVFTAQSTTYPYKCLRDGVNYANLDFVSSCPVGSTKSGFTTTSVCTFTTSCTAPQVRQSDGTCALPPATCTSGVTVSTGPYTTNTSPAVGCLNGCEVLKVQDAPPSINCSIGGTGSVGTCGYVYNNHWVADGVVCGTTATTTLTIPPQASISPDSCAECNCVEKGMSWGTVNGAVLCVARGSTGSHDVVVTTPPVTTTTTPPPTVADPNPAPVTTTAPEVTVTIKGSIGGGSTNGANPMVEQTVKNADGSVTTTSATKDDFCASNPTSKLCKGGETDCDKYPDSVACLTKDQFFGTPTVADLPTTELTQTTSTAPSFSAIGMPSNSTCPAPQTIVIAGTTISISYQWICDYASAFKALLLAFTLMTALSIVLAGIRNDSLPARGSF